MGGQLAIIRHYSESLLKVGTWFRSTVSISRRYRPHYPHSHMQRKSMAFRLDTDYISFQEERDLREIYWNSRVSWDSRPPSIFYG